MSAAPALEELAIEVRLDGAMVRARERLVWRLEAFVRTLRQVGFQRVELERSPTGLLVLVIDPEAISVAMPSGPIFRTCRHGGSCPDRISPMLQEHSS